MSRRGGHIALVVSILAAGVAGACASAQAMKPVTITVGQGAGGAKLDMTRAQVVARLGPPVGHNLQGVLSYRHASQRLGDGNRIFTKGAIDRLYRHCGKRVHRWRIPETGEPNYVICSPYRGHPVRTEFLVGRFSPDALTQAAVRMRTATKP